MKFGLKKQAKKDNQKKALAVLFEDMTGSAAVRSFFPAIKGFLFDTKRAITGIKADGKILKALLFALSINLILIIVAHIFSTYVFKDSTFFLAEFNDLLGKISPVFPLYKGKTGDILPRRSLNSARRKVESLKTYVEKM